MTRGVKPSTIVVASSTLTTVPRPPSGLSKEAKAEWRKVAPILIERRVLTVADLAVLENLCIAYGMMRHAEREVRAHGIVMPDGKRNPASTALIQAQQQHLRAADHLGLSPTARSKTVMVPADDDDDDNPLKV